MCVGHYVDNDGLSHPIDLEIEDVYWVPQCPMNVLATPCIAEQNICLYTGPRGNELYMHGFANQALGRFGVCSYRAQHQSNGPVERKIGQLNESTHAAPLASDLPAYLRPEVYMAMCHTQNIVPSSALQRELKKKQKERLEKLMKGDGEESSTPGEQGDAAAQAAADSPKVPVTDMIPYLAVQRDVTDVYFKQLVGHLKPLGLPVFVYHQRDNMHNLETRSQKGFYMAPGLGPSMD